MERLLVETESLEAGVMLMGLVSGGARRESVLDGFDVFLRGKTVIWGHEWCLY